MELINDIKALKVGDVLDNVGYEELTTYKLKGTAKVVVKPHSYEDVSVLMKYIKENNVKHRIIGNGSNIIFVNDFFDGIIVKLSEFNDIEIDGPIVRVGAGYGLSKLATETANLGLAGLEFGVGIPGAIGGALFMNAGAYNSDVGYVVNKVWVLNKLGEIEILYNRDLNYRYRKSYFQENRDAVILRAEFILKNSKADALVDIIEDRRQRRAINQPLDYPSAGSVFRNPEGHSAWELVEGVGYKGKTIGGATVSEKHSNFIINSGGAKGSDVVSLIDEIKKRVKKKYKIDLVTEQEFIE